MSYINFKNAILSLLVLVIFLLGLLKIYEIEEKKIDKNINNTLLYKQNVLKEYFSISKALLHSYKDLLQNNLKYSSQIEHPSYQNINQASFNSYNIQHQLNNEIPSTLNGIGNTSKINDSLKKEIYSVLQASSIFKTALETLDDIQWIYYSSNKEFIYLAPTDYISNEAFTKEQFKKNFWTEAIPKNNPKMDLILTDLYLDGAGKGMLTTLSLPIKNNNSEFMGVVSIDIGLNFLKKVFANKSLSGNLYLINHNNSIIASSKNSYKYKKINIKAEVFKELNILEDKIKLVYIEDEKKKHIDVIKNSINKILLLIVVLSIISMTYYLTTLIVKIEELANKDSLTLLLNRRAIEKESQKFIDVSKRYKQSISFILLDIDNFKKVNDTYGHAKGDLVIKSVADALKKYSRKADLISRYGGEEFLLTLPNTNLKQAHSLAERIRIEISNLKIEDLNLTVTVSMGCTEYKIESDCLDSAINRADELLYLAKKSGKNQTKI